MAPRSKWTRAERAAAEVTAELMGLSTETVLQRYTTENRRRDAAEHGMGVEEWVEANLAADRFLEDIETMHGRGDSDEEIAQKLGKPAEDIRKIIDGLGLDEPHVEDDMEARMRSAVDAQKPRKGPDLRGNDEWPAQGGDEAVEQVILDAQQRMADSARAWARGEPEPDPYALPTPKFLIRRPDDLRATPRKERHPEAEMRARALSMQLGVSMRTAWKYYDEANADRIDLEDDVAWTVVCLHREGLAPEEISDRIGIISVDEVTGFVASLEEPR